MFKQIIVLEVFGDTSIYTDENMFHLMNHYGIKNSSIINQIPTNSIIGLEPNIGSDNISTEPKIYFPFFSHIQLPIKVGEWVWALEDNENNISNNSYWLSRIVGWNTIDDVNFTHNDKKFLKKENNKIDNILLNGAQIIHSNEEKDSSYKTLILNKNTIDEKVENEYEFIIKNSISENFIQKEAVPKISSRPDEHLIQGSNNSYILLGTDRTENKVSVENIKTKNLKIFKNNKNNKDSNYSLINSDIDFSLTQNKITDDQNILEFKKLSNIEDIGCIDIVAGKKQNNFFQKKDLLTENRKEPLWKERDKSLDIKDKLQYFTEIDQPNFSDDSCRIYVSQKTNISKNFGLDWSPNKNINESVSAIVNKSDHIKSIARKDIGLIFQPNISSNKKDCSYAIINNDIEIKTTESGKITLGNGTDELLKNIYSIVKVLIDNAQSISLSSIGPTSLNPIVLGELNKILNSLSKITKL